MLDSINHMALKLLINHFFGVKTSSFRHLLRNVIMDVIKACFLLNLLNKLGKSDKI